MKKGRLTTILLILILLIGLSLLLYPTVSDSWNAMHQSKAISQYVEQVEELDDEDSKRLWAEAQNYNETLLTLPNRFVLTDAEREQYENVLDVSGTGIMGYIEIPKIDCRLPIYHGTEEAVLQIAVGHLEGTSLPVGGLGTHCVLSGHRGLPSAKLFTGLDQMELGDVFQLQVLNETLTYEVDQILVVLPEEIDALAIDPEQDYCTLLTCTPYGINSHRLLVRGHRIENLPEEKVTSVTGDAARVNPMVVAPFLAAPVLLVLWIVLLVKTRRRR